MKNLFSQLIRDIQPHYLSLIFIKYLPTHIMIIIFPCISHTYNIIVSTFLSGIPALSINKIIDVL